MDYEFTLHASELLGIIALAILTGAGFTAWLASIVLWKSNESHYREGFADANVGAVKLLRRALVETHTEQQARDGGAA